jgi:very-short-patch-repair endonuclease
MEDNFHYNRALKPYARELRKGSTKAEIRLWSELLSGSRMGGYRFLRQRPVAQYIADFLCKELCLIIEVDGFSHDFAEAEEYDARRQRELESLGFTVMRFSDQSVMECLPDVAEIIYGWILEYERTHGKALGKRSKRREEKE